MKSPPEQFRVLKGPFGSTKDYGCNGQFFIPHHRIKDYFYVCLISDGLGWEHVSISLITRKGKTVERCPTWEEMCYIKDLFWTEKECVMQLHPPHSQYINMHKYCLHLWRPHVAPIPLPDLLMV
jgi:hypothetical protein